MGLLIQHSERLDLLITGTRVTMRALLSLIVLMRNDPALYHVSHVLCQSHPLQLLVNDKFVDLEGICNVVELDALCGGHGVTRPKVRRVDSLLIRRAWSFGQSWELLVVRWFTKRPGIPPIEPLRSNQSTLFAPVDRLTCSRLRHLSFASAFTGTGMSSPFPALLSPPIRIGRYKAQCWTVNLWMYIDVSVISDGKICPACHRSHES